MGALSGAHVEGREERQGERDGDRVCVFVCEGGTSQYLFPGPGR